MLTFGNYSSEYSQSVQSEQNTKSEHRHTKRAFFTYFLESSVDLTTRGVSGILAGVTTRTSTRTSADKEQLENLTRTPASQRGLMRTNEKNTVEPSTAPIQQTCQYRVLEQQEQTQRTATDQCHSVPSTDRRKLFLYIS